MGNRLSHAIKKLFGSRIPSSRVQPSSTDANETTVTSKTDAIEDSNAKTGTVSSEDGRTERTRSPETATVSSVLRYSRHCLSASCITNALYYIVIAPVDAACNDTHTCCC